MISALLVLGAGVLLAGCSYADSIGVTSTRKGSGIRILAARCSDERVRAFELRTIGPDQFMYTADDRVLWRVESDRGERVDSAIVGQTLVGFRETVPFTATPPSDEKLAAVVDNHFGSYEAFRIDDLRSGHVRYLGRDITQRKFEDEYPSENCPAPLFGGGVAKPAAVLGGVSVVVFGGFALLFFIIERRIARQRPAVVQPRWLLPAPPGWYPDVSDATGWRWWDGRDWSPRS
jgi:hypothetical protein